MTKKGLMRIKIRSMVWGDSPELLSLSKLVVYLVIIIAVISNTSESAVIDGYLDRLNNYSYIVSDPRGDAIENLEGVDIKRVYLLLTEDQLYVAFEFWGRPRKSLENIDYTLNILTDHQEHFEINMWSGILHVYKWTSLDSSGRSSLICENNDFSIEDVVEFKVPVRCLGNLTFIARGWGGVVSTGGNNWKWLDKFVFGKVDRVEITGKSFEHENTGVTELTVG